MAKTAQGQAWQRVTGSTSCARVKLQTKPHYTTSHPQHHLHSHLRVYAHAQPKPNPRTGKT